MAEIPNVEKHVKDNVINELLIVKIAMKAKAIILRRTKKGEYLKGSTGGSEYSTTPMPIPYGLFIKKFGKEEAKNTYIYRKGKATMVLLPGGYKKFREVSGKSTSPVNLHWSSRMMRNLGIISKDNSSVTLGFSSEEDSRKAHYQHVGAGKNRVKRIFMGLTQREINEIIKSI